jgi:hypothetical protein
MASGSHFRVDSPKIVHQTIDDEVVIINMENGTYFLLEHAGVQVWELLGRAWDRDHIMNHLSRLYPGQADEVQQSVAALFEELRREGLIRALEDAEVPPGTTTAVRTASIDEILRTEEPAAGGSHS